MKKIWRIFELSEISVHDANSSTDREYAEHVSTYLRSEWSQRFQTKEAAEDFLRDEVFGDSKSVYKDDTMIEIVPVYVKQ